MLHGIRPLLDDLGRKLMDLTGYFMGQTDNFNQTGGLPWE